MYHTKLYIVDFSEFYKSYTFYTTCPYSYHSAFLIAVHSYENRFYYTHTINRITLF